MKELLDIYFTFFKISSITFGGGMAMLPILQKELVEIKKWVTDEEIIDYFALSQSMPGIIAVNVASFIGFRKKGLLGEITAGLGIISPCIIIILSIAPFIESFKKIEIIQHAFAGITIGVSALIISAVVNLWKKSVVDKICIILFLMTFFIMIFFDISPIILVIVSAMTGIIVKKTGISL